MSKKKNQKIIKTLKNVKSFKGVKTNFYKNIEEI